MICTKCKIDKAITQFWVRKTKKGRYSHCKDCMKEVNQSRSKAEIRRANLKTVHGMTVQQYNALLDEQNWMCANPGCNVSWEEYHRDFVVDHNHKTGRVRGLLCYRCNILIGMLEADPGVVLGGQDYLGKWR